MVGLAGAPDVEERWATLSPARHAFVTDRPGEVRWAIVDVLLTVRVGLSRRGKVFDSDSVQVTWKTGSTPDGH